jgi:hypothetical protein
MIDEPSIPAVPEPVRQTARDFVSGKEMNAVAMHELQERVSPATWSELARLRGTSRAAPTVEDALAARGPGKTAEQKLDAIITLLAMGK